jgi:hypothetical protein
VRVVPVVRLIAFRFPEAGLFTTTMEHRGGRDDDDGALPWLGGGPVRAGAGTGGTGAPGEVPGNWGRAGRVLAGRVLAGRVLAGRDLRPGA